MKLIIFENVTGSVRVLSINLFAQPFPLLPALLSVLPHWFSSPACQVEVK